MNVYATELVNKILLKKSATSNMKKREVRNKIGFNAIIYVRDNNLPTKDGIVSFTQMKEHIGFVVLINSFLNPGDVHHRRYYLFFSVIKCGESAFSD